MVLAAGLGTRMRPLTNDRPKALVEVAGRTLVDHMLDRLAQAGVETAVVNVHAFADRLEDHLKARTAAPTIVISDERGELLETGGGLRKARPLLGDEPVFVANIDSVWTEDGDSAIASLAKAWDPERMDVCLLLARLDRTLGFDGAGDFFLADDGVLTFRGEAPSAPYAYMGVHICKPDLVEGGPDGAFSLATIWRKLAPLGRVHGVVMDGFWMHVGDPGARDEAEAKLAEAEGG
ncbi:N-acetylmuramate alpha-1-phosphate uridylyltransferase MurU [Caulobacter hibisci]|uniref:Nucleotidyltransferase family protein n=1 Tax=Caulobacter hibisci TaxID=2035993 RepID=A0ABS0T3I2_9CAUL|nr:nucleotidyltransferase family protein [Caulobacter hibisci]MBI1686316.1 nucleotidyltransferase family protein [Caulobacter hibisci]